MQALGLNYRMTDMQCALAISQFRKLDRFVARRLDIARRYDAVFAICPESSCRSGGTENAARTIST